MSIATEKTPITLNQLLASEDACRFELVDGELEEVHVSNLSVCVGGKIHVLLSMHCDANKLGQVFPADAYYQCFGEHGMSARKPDVSFISRDRLPASWLTEGFFTIPPDLAVEVLSTNDTALEGRRKVGEYLQAGVRLVWEVEPVTRTVLVHRLDGSRQMLDDNHFMSGEDVLPGFQCKVADFLP